MTLETKISAINKQLKDIEPILYPFILIKLIYINSHELESEINIRHKDIESVYDWVKNIMKRYESLIDIKETIKDIALLVREKPIKSIISEIMLIPPSQEIKRILRAIEKDKRLADLIYYEDKELLDSLIKKNKDSPLTQLLQSETSGNKYIFTERDIVSEYFDNSHVLVIFNFTIKYLRKQDYLLVFKKVYLELEEIKTKSKTIITNKLSKKDFPIWLYNYVEKNIIGGITLTSQINYIPLTDEHKKNLILHQLDVWAYDTPKDYRRALEKIQSAWNKRSHDLKKLDKNKSNS